MPIICRIRLSTDNSVGSHETDFLFISCAAETPMNFLSFSSTYPVNGPMKWFRRKWSHSKVLHRKAEYSYGTCLGVEWRQVNENSTEIFAGYSANCSWKRILSSSEGWHSKSMNWNKKRIFTKFSKWHKLERKHRYFGIRMA